MIVLDAKFEKSTPGAALAPKPDLPEICFVGRSNVGKSSALNVLTSRKKLARVSHTPGRTRLLNFFRVELAERPGPGSRKGAVRFCDLPGYGFAKAAAKDRAEWGEWITDYLAKRESLSAVVMLVDGEVGVQPKDKDMIDLLAASHRQIIVVATKTDRLPKTRRESSLDRVARDLKVPRSAVFAFSSHENIGHDELWRALCAATGLFGKTSERILEPATEVGS